MMQKPHLILLALALAAWLSWLFRYDLADGQPVVLDRWTGTAIFPIAGDHQDLGDTTPR